MTETSFPIEVLGCRMFALCQRVSHLALLTNRSQSWRGLAAHWDDAPLGRYEPNSGVYCVSVLFCVKQKQQHHALDELHKGAKPKALVPQSRETRST